MYRGEVAGVYFDPVWNAAMFVIWEETEGAFRAVRVSQSKPIL